MMTVTFYRSRERAGYFIKKRVALIAVAFIHGARRVLRWTGTRCSWCGADPGFQSSYSRKGLRCHTLERKCDEMP
jgi:hypothetical protein